MTDGPDLWLARTMQTMRGNGWSIEGLARVFKLTPSGVELYLKRDVVPATTRTHDGPCIYCEHGPYCTACPPPPVIADDAPVCGNCREEITRSEIAADPYYSGGAAFGDGA